MNAKSNAHKGNEREVEPRLPRTQTWLDGFTGFAFTHTAVDTLLARRRRRCYGSSPLAQLAEHPEGPQKMVWCWRPQPLPTGVQIAHPSPEMLGE